MKTRDMADMHASFNREKVKGATAKIFIGLMFLLNMPELCAVPAMMAFNTLPSLGRKIVKERQYNLITPALMFLLSNMVLLSGAALARTIYSSTSALLITGAYGLATAFHFGNAVYYGMRSEAENAKAHALAGVTSLINAALSASVFVFNKLSLGIGGALFNGGMALKVMMKPNPFSPRPNEQEAPAHSTTSYLGRMLSRKKPTVDNEKLNELTAEPKVKSPVNPLNLQNLNNVNNLEEDASPRDLAVEPTALGISSLKP